MSPGRDVAHQYPVAARAQCESRSLGTPKVAHDTGGHRRGLRPFVSTQLVEGHLLRDIDLSEVLVEPPEGGFMQARPWTRGTVGGADEEDAPRVGFSKGESDICRRRLWPESWRRQPPRGGGKSVTKLSRETLNQLRPDRLSETSY